LPQSLRLIADILRSTAYWSSTAFPPEHIINDTLTAAMICTNRNSAAQAFITRELTQSLL